MKLDGPTLVIFAKAPIAGQVKTRLAPALGHAGAAALYRRLLDRLVARLAPAPGWTTLLAVTPDAAATDAALWPAPSLWGPARHGQGQGDLGQRMRAWLDRARPDAPLVLVGSDIPAMTAAHIADGFAALRAAPGALVFGPAEDGGFWLIGADRPPPPALFTSVRWSTAHALADTLASLGAHPVRQIARLRDLDEPEDLAALEDDDDR